MILNPPCYLGWVDHFQEGGPTARMPSKLSNPHCKRQNRLFQVAVGYSSSPPFTAQEVFGITLVAG